jgi:hypothetical protein
LFIEAAQIIKRLSDEAGTEALQCLRMISNVCKVLKISNDQKLLSELYWSSLDVLQVPKAFMPVLNLCSIQHLPVLVKTLKAMSKSDSRDDIIDKVPTKYHQPLSVRRFIVVHLPCPN